MAFDPSVISSIPDSMPNPVESLQKAATLKDMLDRGQLTRLQTESAKRDATERTKVDEILKGSDYSTPQGLAETAAKVNKVSPRSAMDLMKQGQAYQSGQVQQQLDQLTLASQRQDLIVGAIDPIVAQARSMKNGGASDLAVKAFITQQMPQALEQLRNMKLGDGNPALPDDVLKMASSVPGGYTLETLEGWESKSKSGAAAIKQRLEQFKADTQERREDETERRNRATENLAGQRIQISRDKAGGLTSESTDSLAEQAMAGDTSALVGLSPADKVKVRNRMADVQQIRGLTGADQAAANAQFAGVKAGERTLGTRQANIDTAVTEAQNVLPLVLEASKSLDRGKFVPFSKLIQIAERGTSDPNYYRFAQGVRTLANLYTRAVVPGASGVMDREESLKSLPTFTDQKSFESVVQFMLKEMEAAKASPAQVRRDMANAITGRTESPASPGETPKPGAPPASPKPNFAPGAAPARASSPQAAPGAGAAPGSKLEPGKKYEHSSGATVEILD